jgi:hypothetical protein
MFVEQQREVMYRSVQMLTLISIAVNITFLISPSQNGMLLSRLKNEIKENKLSVDYASLPVRLSIC